MVGPFPYVFGRGTGAWLDLFLTCLGGVQGKGWTFSLRVWEGYRGMVGLFPYVFGRGTGAWLDLFLTCLGGVQGKGWTFSLRVWEGYRGMVGPFPWVSEEYRTEGMGKTFFVYGRAWVDLLVVGSDGGHEYNFCLECAWQGKRASLGPVLVYGRDRGHSLDLFLVYGGGREAWLYLLLVCGRESEGHRSDLFLVYGRDRGHS